MSRTRLSKLKIGLIPLNDCFLITLLPSWVRVLPEARLDARSLIISSEVINSAYGLIVPETFNARMGTIPFGAAKQDPRFN
jgi:hypothetical protein